MKSLSYEHWAAAEAKLKLVSAIMTNNFEL